MPSVHGHKSVGFAWFPCNCSGFYLEFPLENNSFFFLSYSLFTVRQILLGVCEENEKKKKKTTNWMVLRVNRILRWLNLTLEVAVIPRDFWKRLENMNETIFCTLRLVTCYSLIADFGTYTIDKYWIFFLLQTPFILFLSFDWHSLSLSLSLCSFSNLFNAQIFIHFRLFDSLDFDWKIFHFCFQLVVFVCVSWISKIDYRKLPFVFHRFLRTIWSNLQMHSRTKSKKNNCCIKNTSHCATKLKTRGDYFNGEITM